MFTKILDFRDDLEPGLYEMPYPIDNPTGTLILFLTKTISLMTFAPKPMFAEASLDEPSTCEIVYEGNILPFKIPIIGDR